MIMIKHVLLWQTTPTTHPRFTSSFEERSTSEEIQVDLIEDIAWQLSKQLVLEEEQGRVIEQVVKEEAENIGEGAFDLSQVEDLTIEDERVVEGAVEVQ
ncbi:unnamed protein product [Linum trigynum]|uniref:Uncharacterized protein n=1 Tax=Linum trigynum TaxID=586398 RepID=A0AAV2D026_9ROSI